MVSKVIDLTQPIEPMLRRLRSVSGLLARFVPALTASALAGVVAASVLTTQRGALLRHPWLLSLVALLCLLAWMLPLWVERLTRDANRLEAEQRAYAGLQSALASTSAETWTLLFNLPDGDFGRMPDAVIMSQRALVAIDFVWLDGTHQNNGDVWRRRDDEGAWEPINENPTQRVLAAAQHCADHFGLARDLIQPALLWTSDSLLLHDAASVPLWLHNHVEPMVAWLDDLDTVPTGDHAMILEKLKSRVELRPKSISL